MKAAKAPLDRARQSIVSTISLFLLLLVALPAGAQQSTDTPLAPGDENWDNRFGPLGINSRVHVIAINGNDVYVGGRFATAGGVSASNIARWDGSQWHALGSGVGGGSYPHVFAIAIRGNDVYVGGMFTMAGGQPVNFIARWDGSQWHPLNDGVSNGLDGGIFSIVFNGSDMYVGGGFSMAGGTSANDVARWDGTQWHPLGSGLNGVEFSDVYGMGMRGNNLYVGGSFDTAGGVSASHVARWDIAQGQWFPLGAGVNNDVNAFAFDAEDVYASGMFTMTGGVSANRIARWDGTQWHPLGSGLDATVFTTVMAGNDLYVGGEFNTAGGISANNIARWNGQYWSALGSGVSHPSMPESVGGIAINGSDIYVGGMFTTAGVVASNHFGLWHEPGLAGHLIWEGRPSQPDPLQQLPVTLTLKSGANELNYYSQSTTASGVFTAAVGSLAPGSYNWRVKNPKYLANSGVVSLTGTSTVSVEMGLMRAGDANDDNAVSIADFNILRNTFGRTIGDPDYDDRADFNGDQIVNTSDFLMVKINYGQVGAPPARPEG